MEDYRLKGIDGKLWRKGKKIAALQGMNVKDFIIRLAEKRTRKLKE
jgi:hypothetical protein